MAWDEANHHPLISTFSSRVQLGLNLLIVVASFWCSLVCPNVGVITFLVAGMIGVAIHVVHLHHFCAALAWTYYLFLYAISMTIIASPHWWDDPCRVGGAPMTIVLAGSLFGINSLYQICVVWWAVCRKKDVEPDDKLGEHAEVDPVV